VSAIDLAVLAANDNATLDVVVTELRHLKLQVVELVKAVSASKPARLVSVSEAAEALGVSEVTVRRRIKDGKLPVKRIGRAVRVDLRGL
jgi:excisionase family DNA binding protein